MKDDKPERRKFLGKLAAWAVAIPAFAAGHTGARPAGMNRRD